MLKIIDGDIFESGADIIAHQVNCQGVMGSGVAKQVREKYPLVFRRYREQCEMFGSDLLGVCYLFCENDLATPIIANLFAQDKFGYDGKCYTDYDALRNALSMLKTKINTYPGLSGVSPKIAIPYLMGCHRGGGDWEIVSKMIEEELAGCDVTLYRYTGG